MSGVLEQMRAELTAANTAIANLQAAVQALSAGGTAAPAAAASDPFAGLGGLGTPAATAPAQPEVPANVTGDMITELIMPHVDNPAVKEQLGAAMRSLGFNGLPEVTPDKYRDLYAAFLPIIAAAKAGTPAAAVSAGSII